VATQRVLIVGGGGGIGSAVARLLAADGHRLFLAGRNTARVDSVAAELAAGTASVLTKFSFL